MYYLFSCPNCGKVAHKRCWYNHGEVKKRNGWFGKKEWRLVCPNCEQQISSKRFQRVDWKKGYQIPGYPDSELPELYTADVLAWKTGSIFGKIGQAVDGFFKSIGLGSLTDSETGAITKAAKKIGKAFRDVAERVFKLEIPVEKRREITALTCQNCGAPLPMPEPYEEAVVCENCGTAHLLPV